MATYLNRNKGTVKLYVNNVLLIKRVFFSIKERKELMRTWSEIFAFTGMSNIVVYIEISHYEVEMKLVKEQKSKPLKKAV